MDNIITKETNFKDLFNAEMLRDLDDLAIVGEVVGEFVEAAEINILYDSGQETPTVLYFHRTIQSVI